MSCDWYGGSDGLSWDCQETEIEEPVHDDREERTLDLEPVED